MIRLRFLLPLFMGMLLPMAAHAHGPHAGGGAAVEVVEMRAGTSPDSHDRCVAATRQALFADFAVQPAAETAKAGADRGSSSGPGCIDCGGGSSTHACPDGGHVLRMASPASVRFASAPFHIPDVLPDAPERPPRAR